jgi:hypothetical protein
VVLGRVTVIFQRFLMLFYGMKVKESSGLRGGDFLLMLCTLIVAHVSLDFGAQIQRSSLWHCVPKCKGARCVLARDISVCQCHCGFTGFMQNGCLTMMLHSLFVQFCSHTVAILRR